MPSFKNADDKAAALAIERWEIEAEHWVDDMRDWRDGNPNERIWEGGWPDWGRWFDHDTHVLTDWVLRELPGLAPQPIQDFRAIARTWYGDLHDPSGLPPQAKVEATYEAARGVLALVREAILRRCVCTARTGVEGLRSAYGRDHLFLKWNEEDKLSPAPIRNKWNALSDTERKRICPLCWEPVGDGEDGREVVKQGIRKAKKERKLKTIPGIPGPIPG
jgi:hypothetical protein